jgi:hypothetical protein
MKQKTIDAQLSNYKTTLNYKNKMLSLALNVFQFKNVDPFIDMSKVNMTLFQTGSIAFFKDDITGTLMAMPYTIVGSLDYYGRPQAIMPLPYFGAYKRTLYAKNKEFVIMWDNESHIPLYPELIASAKRLAQIKRAIDINISQQNTNRIWKTTEDKLVSLDRALQQVDSNVNTIITYDDLDLNEIGGILQVAPFVADKLNDAKKEEWSEFLETIGITSNIVNKKERLITDEVFTSMGGTIAFRYNRYESRRKAVELINKYFGTNIEVEFYDGLPSTIKDPDVYLENEDETVEDRFNENIDLNLEDKGDDSDV